MEYITTKELAAAWNVSVSRIVRLAKAGRIPGARLIGNSWAFPIDSKKPADHRRKENLRKQEPPFRFPLYLYHNYSEKQISEEFTADEATLYQAQQLYLHRSYSSCIQLLSVLLKQTSDRYVRYGALYYLSLAHLSLGNYLDSVNYYSDIHSLFTEETLHRPEMELLIHDLDTFFYGINWYLNSYSVNLPNDYPYQMNGFLAVTSLYADVVRQLFSDFRANLVPYEIMCNSQASNFSHCTLMILNAYLGILFYGQGLVEKSSFHIKRACQLAIEHKILHEMIYVYYLFREAFDEALKDGQTDLLHTLQDISVKHMGAWFRFLEFFRNDDFFAHLTHEDYKLFFYAKQQTPHKAIAVELGTSVSNVSRKYNQLYERTGAKNKKELYELLTKKLCQYDVKQS